MPGHSETGLSLPSSCAKKTFLPAPCGVQRTSGNLPTWKARCWFALLLDHQAFLGSSPRDGWGTGRRATSQRVSSHFSPTLPFPSLKNILRGGRVGAERTGFDLLYIKSKMYAWNPKISKVKSQESDSFSLCYNLLFLVERCSRGNGERGKGEGEKVGRAGNRNHTG